MSSQQIEKQFPRYALAYLRYLAGERATVPTPTPQPLFDGITTAEIPAVHKRVRELVGKVAALDKVGRPARADQQ